MAVTILWDTWLKPGTETEGLQLTRQVWSLKATCRIGFSSIRMPRAMGPGELAKPRGRGPGSGEIRDPRRSANSLRCWFVLGNAG